MFCNKIWNSYKFIRNLIPEDFKPLNIKDENLKFNSSDKWIL